MTRGGKFCLIAAAACLQGIAPCIGQTRDFAVAVYGAQLTREKWEHTISPDTRFTGATLVSATASWTALRFFDGKLSCDVEAGVGKYFGEQDNWEFNLPILGLRWHRFPWDHRLATSLAWGIGPSYATRVPEIELETNDDSQRWLIYWYGELTLGPRESNWEVLMRLHHRSDGFGTVADDGGSNAVGAGVRYRF
ncbi:hypothetical protein [Pontiella sulfatireligans]|uniref:Acyloxyacyl hydrolase n=1 Tax=Pontiella sulfatireligans TaxID=2750658 RepID=A0A6C2UPJ6_9BACT|nr:hypothetical protein [Pontiella sulfatireligans]VGO22212.1 hypothetical protein SCARR_04294 [Pontiella sulfatireligans]